MMSANTLELPQDIHTEDADYHSPLHDDPKFFTGQTDAERVAQAEHALGVAESHVDVASRQGDRNQVEVLGYVGLALEHELRRRRGEYVGKPPKPPSALGA